MCTRETSAIFDAGGLQCTLTFINDFGSHVHKDTLHSSMSVVSRLCSRMEPQDTNLETCVHSLSTLLKQDDAFVSILDISQGYFLFFVGKRGLHQWTTVDNNIVNIAII